MPSQTENKVYNYRNIIFGANLLLLIFFLYRFEQSLLSVGGSAVLLFWAYWKSRNTSANTGSVSLIPFLLFIDCACFCLYMFPERLAFSDAFDYIADMFRQLLFPYLSVILILIAIVSRIPASKKSFFWIQGVLITVLGALMIRSMFVSNSDLFSEFLGSTYIFYLSYLVISALWVYTGQIAILQNSANYAGIYGDGIGIFLCYFLLSTFGHYYILLQFPPGQSELSVFSWMNILIIAGICAAAAFLIQSAVSEKPRFLNSGAQTLLSIATFAVIFRWYLNMDGFLRWGLLFLILAASCYEVCSSLSKKKTFGLYPIPYLLVQLLLGWISSYLMSQSRWISLAVLVLFLLYMTTNFNKLQEYRNRMLLWTLVNLFFFLFDVCWNLNAESDPMSFLIPALILAGSLLTIYTLSIAHPDQKKVPNGYYLAVSGCTGILMLISAAPNMISFL